MDTTCMAIRIEESPTRGLLPPLEPVKSRTKQRMLHRLHRLFGRDGSPSPSPGPQTTTDQPGELQQPATRRPSGRNVGIGLPRPGTFRRQNSEKRERLEPVEPCPSERRAVSSHRQQRAHSAYRPRSRSSPSPNILARVSAPSLSLSNSTCDPLGFTDHSSLQSASANPTELNNGTTNKSLSPYRSPSQPSSEKFDQVARDEKHEIDLELDTKWILNLSMHFRDKSDREKFFVTFAQEPNRWRRVTISCDYRNAEPDSLETDLKDLQYQRDKNAQIYESIRDSLSSIQFYNTVTNLKLETEHGRLHVHVTEDVNEIIPYPPRLSVQHLLADRANLVLEARENQINFLSHLSGFVYKVSFQGREYIKKEIPGPDTVDEFLYEINALHALSASKSVIKLEAIVFDDTLQTVKGLLISYAERGALVDLLYDHKHDIPWADRMRWAGQAIQGLSEIHEEGYVQGDFTLSNIVINSENDAKIIDINRRGCPVGWEPPEIANKIASNQRISMYIGQKSDLYQLGMTLWALAMDEDEPERHDQPLSMAGIPEEVPGWYKEIVKLCLSAQPRNRPSAKDLLHQFPLLPSENMTNHLSPINDIVDERSPKKYIEPCAAVEREDLERLGRRRRRSMSEGPSNEDASFIERPSSSYQFDSGSSFVGIRRGRAPASHSENADERNSGQIASDDHGIDACDGSDLAPRIISVSPGRAPRYEGFETDPTHHQEHQTTRSYNHSTFLENQPPIQLPVSDQYANQIAASAPLSVSVASGHETELGPQDVDLELPSPHQPLPNPGTTSMASDSTPRNATSGLATSTSSIVSPPTLDIAAADLAGFGGHPSLDEYCPHEPRKASDSQNSQYHDAQAEQDDNLAPADIPLPGNELQASNFVEPPSEALATEMLGVADVSERPETLNPLTLGLDEKQPLPLPL
jgi:Protein tyrosine and serine/threonine kinase